MISEKQIVAIFFFGGGWNAFTYIDFILTQSRSQGWRGGLEPPNWLLKYAKLHVFSAFEADFL